MYTATLLTLLLQVEESSTIEFLGQGLIAEIASAVSPILLGILYFLPAAFARKKRTSTSIFLLNLFLGWTILGWIGALIWALSPDEPPVVVRQSAAVFLSVADEITKLQLLRNRGTLTEEEFQQQRSKVLSRA